MIYKYLSIIFLYIFIAILGMILISYIVIEFIYKFIFDLKQKLNKLFIIFIASLVMIGIGSSLTFVKILSYEYKENSDDLTLKTSEEYLDIDVNTHIYFGTNNDNIQYIIDNSLNNVKLEIIYPEDFDYVFDNQTLIDDEIGNVKYYHVYLIGMNPFELYKMILNDFKNNTIRTYDNYDLMQIKVYLSEDDYKLLKENHIINY